MEYICDTHRSQKRNQSIININLNENNMRNSNIVNLPSNINNSDSSINKIVNPSVNQETQYDELIFAPIQAQIPSPIETKEVGIGTKEEITPFEVKETRLYQIFEKYYGIFGELSDHVYNEFDEYNILSPQDTYSALVKIKLIIQRMEKGVKDESDTNFAKSYFKIGSHTLEYLMNICNLKEYYAKVKLNYSDDNLANSIKTLIRIKKMYRVIDSLASIFKLIKQKEQTGDEEIAKLIHSEVS